jgi:guanylate kinase
VNYHFIVDAEFDRLVAAGAFLEWAEVHGSRYGTLRSEVDAALEQGRTVVLEIDVQGARSVRAAEPAALLVFVQPPAWDVLESRLRNRGTEPEEAVALRLQNAHDELAAASDFDLTVVNDDLDAAVQRLSRILDEHAAPSRGPSQE